MTQIFLLGTFHFYQTNIKFASGETQAKLQELVNKVAIFNPDTIAVEMASHQQKMMNNDLGNIMMFGETKAIPYNNECVQIAYRLGKILDIKKIYGVDDYSELSNRRLENSKLMLHC